MIFFFKEEVIDKLTNIETINCWIKYIQGLLPDYINNISKNKAFQKRKSLPAALFIKKWNQNQMYLV